MRNTTENKNKPCTIHNVVGSTVIETTTRELEPYEFHCSKCNTIHKKTAYAIAQHTMGIELIFTCTCGNKIDL